MLQVVGSRRRGSAGMARRGTSEVDFTELDSLHESLSEIVTGGGRGWEQRNWRRRPLWSGREKRGWMDVVA